MVTGEEPLLALLRELGARGYEFTAVTPATHARVCSRPVPDQPSLRDIFGWNREFREEGLEPDLLQLLKVARATEMRKDRLRSKVRVGSLDGTLFLHSGYPTDEAHSVFFGPDTYRFVRFVRQQLPRFGCPASVIDMGAGSGAGGIRVAREIPGSRVTLVDVNHAALRLATINAAYAGVCVEIVEGPKMPSGADLVIANPPYMIDVAHRTYRDGGGLLGGAVSLDWTRQALKAMAPGGTLLLYTGAAIRSGNAPLVDALQQTCREGGANLAIEELDPDVFGEELGKPAYANVERIAAIGAVISSHK